MKNKEVKNIIDNFYNIVQRNKRKAEQLDKEAKIMGTYEEIMDKFN